MMKITFLGVEGYPQGNRSTISILLEYQDYRILLDCGGSIIGQLDRHGLSACDVDAVFVSHLHADHSSGLPLLLFGNLMERFEKRVSGPGNIAILGNQANIEPVVSYCKAAYPALFGVDSLIRIDLVNIGVFTPLETISGIVLESAPISHTIQGQSLALSIGGYRICYTSDTRRTEMLDNLAKGSDLLICNVLGCDDNLAESFGFLSAAGAANLAHDIGASKLAMIHLPSVLSMSDATKVASDLFSGDIVTPVNGESFLIS